MDNKARISILKNYAELAWAGYFFLKILLISSLKRVTKDRDNRDENHKEIHLGLLWQYPLTHPT